MDSSFLRPPLSDIEAFAIFLLLLDPPTAAPDSPSTVRGRDLFKKAGCAACYTPALRTGPMISSGASPSPSTALSGKTAHLYSDLLLHHMGEGLSDGITQGAAGPDEFRTAPLWGVGRRIFFLHDGRTKDLLQAIESTGRGGVKRTRSSSVSTRTGQEQQDIINFLRSL